MRAPIVQRRRLRLTAITAAALLGGVVIGGLSIVRPDAALAAAAVAVIAATAVSGAVSVLLVALPGLFLARRVGPAALNISGADLVLVITTVVALPFVPWHKVLVRRVATAVALYLGLLLIVVAAHLTERAVLEWAHRGAMLIGGVAVGAAIAHAGHTRRAVRILMAAAAAVAVMAVLQGLGNGLEPASPFGLQKNYSGGLLAMCLVVAVVAPGVLRLTHGVLAVVRIVLFGGLLATQSRGAIASLVIALILWSLTQRRSPIKALTVAPAAAVLVLGVVLSLHADARRSQSDFTSANSRRIANDQAAKVWRNDRILGAGLRYFRTPGYRFDLPSYRDSYIEPHSVWYATLAESGIAGLGGLALLLILTLRAVRLAPRPLAVAAALVLVAKLTQGMADIYWVAGTQTLPWLLIGLAVGAGPNESHRQEGPSESIVPAVR